MADPWVYYGLMIFGSARELNNFKYIMTNIRLLGILLMALLLFSCQGKKDKNAVVSTLVSEQDSVSENQKKEKYKHLDGKVSPFMSVTYVNEFYEPDTMYAAIKDKQYMIDPSGFIYNPDGSVFMNMECDESIDEGIQKMYFHVDDDTLYAFLELTDMDCGWSSIVKLDLNKKKIIWRVPFGSFNVGQPVARNNHIYLSSLGTIGKIDQVTGKYKWKYDNLYDDGKYNNFHRIYFKNDNEIVFAADSLTSDKTHLIVVNDSDGKIICKD